MLASLRGSIQALLTRVSSRTEASAEASSVQGGHTSPENRSRPYVFMVVFLALFVTAICLMKTRPTAYVATVTLRQEFAGHKATVERLAAEDPTPTFQKLRADVTPELADTPSPFPPETIVLQPDAADPNSRFVLVRYRASDPNVALTQLTTICQEFVAAHNKASNEAEILAARDELRNQVRFWKGRRETIGQELTTAIEAEVARRQSEFEKELAEYEAKQKEKSAAPVAEPPVLPQIENPNPRWERLQTEIAAAHRELDRLLETHTEAHPEVVAAQDVVDSLKRKLHETTPTLRQESPSLAASPVVPPEPETSAEGNASADLPPPVWDRPAEQAKIEHLPAIAALREARDKSESQRNEAEQRLAALPPVERCYSVTTVVCKPPHLSGLEAKPVSRGHLAGWGMPAVLVAAICAWIANGRQFPEVLSDVSEVRRLLKTGEVIPLPTPGGPEVPQPSVTRAAIGVSRLVFASELAVLAALVLVVICFVRVPDYGSRIASDPLTTLSMSLHYLKMGW